LRCSSLPATHSSMISIYYHFEKESYSFCP
jgi:hypothetical protein